MSSTGLPVSVDPNKFAEQQIELKGNLAFSQLFRMEEVTLGHAGDVVVCLRFHKDEQGRTLVSGKIEATVVLECQRCLDKMTQELKPDVQLCIVYSDDQAKNLPKSYDPYLLDGCELVIADLVEEELLLSLPSFGAHEPGECTLDYDASDESEDDTSVVVEKSNPFSVLADFKVKK